MADRRPWPIPARPAAERLRASTMRAERYQGTHAEMNAFLRGLQLAEAACLDVVDSVYERADAAAADDRANLNRAAAGAKTCASHIAGIVDHVSHLAAAPPTRHGVKALVARLRPAAPPPQSTARKMP
jgi:hypothetical protein